MVNAGHTVNDYFEPARSEMDPFNVLPVIFQQHLASSLPFLTSSSLVFASSLDSASFVSIASPSLVLLSVSLVLASVWVSESLVLTSGSSAGLVSDFWVSDSDFSRDEK